MSDEEIKKCQDDITNLIEQLQHLHKFIKTPIISEDYRAYLSYCVSEITPKIQYSLKVFERKYQTQLSVSKEGQILSSALYLLTGE